MNIELDDSIFVDRESELNDMRLDVSSNILKPEIYISKKYGVSIEEAKAMMPDMEAQLISP